MRGVQYQDQEGVRKEKACLVAFRSFRRDSKRFKEKNMQKVIKFVLVMMLALGAVGLTSSAGADPGHGGGACAKC